jgi:hypothetical protein
MRRTIVAASWSLKLIVFINPIDFVAGRLKAGWKPLWRTMGDE